MELVHSYLNGVLLIKPSVYGDDRGFFKEVLHPQKMNDIGIRHRFVQINHSKSEQWILRGLHFQHPPYAQSKLVRCLRGSIYDVAVDIRPKSDTFGKAIGVELSEENHLMLYVPEGFAHGFLTLTEADVEYACGEIYSPDHEGAVAWNDKALEINWPLPNGVEPIVSAKDAIAKPLTEITESLIWPEEVYH